MRTLLLVFLIFQLTFTWAQNSQEPNIYETNKINLSQYRRLLENYSKSFPDSLERVSRRLLSLSIEQNNEDGEHLAYEFLGDYCSEMGSYKLAFDYLFKAKDFYLKKKAYTELSELYNFIGNAYFRKGEYKNALEWYKRQIQLADDANDSWLKNLSKINLGRTYIILGKEKQGEGIILAYIAAAKKANKNNELVNAYNVLGGYYQSVEDYNLATSYFQEALSINLAINNLRNVAHSYNNLAISYFYENKADMARSYFFKALHIREQLGIKVQIAESYYNIGDWYYFNNLFDSAKVYYTKSLEVGENLSSFGEVADAYLALSELEKTRGNFKEALSYHAQYADALGKQFEESIGDSSKIETMNAFSKLMQTRKMNNLINENKNRLSTTLNHQFFIEKIVFFIVIALLFTICVLLFFKQKKQEKMANETAMNSFIQNKEEKMSLSSKILSSSNELSGLQQSVLNFIEHPITTHFMIFSENGSEKTRSLPIGKHLFFIWDSPVNISKSIELYLFFKLNIENLKNEEAIDDLLQKQEIVSPHEIDWMILDKNKIVFKSGFLQINNERLLSFSKEDVENKTWIVHSKFPETSLKQIYEICQIAGQLDTFSDNFKMGLIKKLKDNSETMTDFCLIYLVE